MYGNEMRMMAEMAMMQQLSPADPHQFLFYGSSMQLQARLESLTDLELHSIVNAHITVTGVQIK